MQVPEETFAEAVSRLRRADVQVLARKQLVIEGRRLPTELA
jgi:hypothetical protein